MHIEYIQGFQNLGPLFGGLSNALYFWKLKLLRACSESKTKLLTLTCKETMLFTTYLHYGNLIEVNINPSYRPFLLGDASGLKGGLRDQDRICR